MTRAILIAFLLIPVMATGIFGNCDDSCIKIGVAYPKVETAAPSKATAQTEKADDFKDVATGRKTASPQEEVPYFKNVLELFKQQFAGKLGEKLRVDLAGHLDRVEFVYNEYTEGNKAEARAVAESFASDESIVAVIGYMRSAEAAEVAEIFDSNKLVLITPTATNPAVTRGHDWVFSMTYTDDWQGSVIAAFLGRVQKWKNVVLIYEDSPEKDNIYEKGLADSFEKWARNYSVNIVETLKVPTDSDVTYIFHAAKGEPSSEAIDAVVLFATTAEASKIVRQIRLVNTHVPIVVPDGLSGRTFVEGTLAIHKELRLREPRVLVANRFFYELAPLKASIFRGAYKAEYKDEEPKIYEVFTNDAAYLVAWAAMKATKKKENVRPSPRDMRRAVQENIAGLSCARKSLAGISGQLYFNSDGAMPRNVLFAWVPNTGVEDEEEIVKGRGTIPRLIPAYSQLKDVSVNECDKNSRADGAKLHSLAGLSRELTALDSDPDSPHVRIHGRDMKRISVVRAGVDFYRINEIDLTRQRFDIETFVWFKWKGPLSILNSEEAQKPADVMLFWNGIHGIEDQTQLLFRKDKQDKEKLKTIAFKVKGTYLEHYALQDYPFDTQTLSVRMSLAKKDTDDVWLVVDNATIQTSREIRRRYGEKDFKIFPAEYSPVKLRHAAGTAALPSSLGNEHAHGSGGSNANFSVYETSLELRRNTFQYLLTLFLPLAILTAISLAVFWIPLDQFSVRISIVLTTLLSVLVFHLSRAEKLPNVGYLTVADQFFIASYLGMSMNIGLTITYEWLRSKGRGVLADRLNRLVRYVLVAVTLVFIAIFGRPALQQSIGEQAYFIIMLCVLMLLALFEIFPRGSGVRSTLSVILRRRGSDTAKETK